MSADIPRELVEQFARGNGVIFVGAGLSMGAGLPGGVLCSPPWLTASVCRRTDASTCSRSLNTTKMHADARR